MSSKRSKFISYKSDNCSFIATFGIGCGCSMKFRIACSPIMYQLFALNKLNSNILNEIFNLRKTTYFAINHRFFEM